MRMRVVAKFHTQSKTSRQKVRSLFVEAAAVKKYRSACGAVGVAFVVVGVDGEDVFKGLSRRVVKRERNQFSRGGNMRNIHVGSIPKQRILMGGGSVFLFGVGYGREKIRREIIRYLLVGRRGKGRLDVCFRAIISKRKGGYAE